MLAAIIGITIWIKLSITIILVLRELNVIDPPSGLPWLARLPQFHRGYPPVNNPFRTTSLLMSFCDHLSCQNELILFEYIDNHVLSPLSVSSLTAETTESECKPHDLPRELVTYSRVQQRTPNGMSLTGWISTRPDQNRDDDWILPPTPRQDTDRDWR